MQRVLDTPVGPVTVVADGDLLVGLFMEARPPTGTAAVLDAAAEQLAAYFNGDLIDFDLPVAPSGTPFQQRVWDELRTIPFGETVTYRDLAVRIGRPSACRAVGAANGRNPISIIVPCHRVVGSDGSLTGYGGGIERKRWLLAHEATVSCRSLC